MPSHTHDLAQLGLVAHDDPVRYGRFPDHKIEQMLANGPRFPMLDDAVIVCIDVEKDCSPDHLLCEIGITSVDTRNFQGRAPGDRGEDWVRQFNTQHIRVRDNPHPRALTEPFYNYYRQPRYRGNNVKHLSYCHPRSEDFAFGDTILKTLAEIPKYLDDKWLNWRRPTPGKRDTPGATPRNIILVVWDSNMEVQTLQDLNLGHWLDECHTLIDFQGYDAASAIQPHYHTNRKEKLGLSRMLTAFAIPTNINGVEITHNGGNDSALELQVYLASILISQKQFGQLCAQGYLDIAKDKKTASYGQVRHIQRNRQRARDMHATFEAEQRKRESDRRLAARRRSRSPVRYVTQTHHRRRTPPPVQW
ncbi:hypothetical protein B9Z65_1142 [Elsinoe australis]|uniref:Gfd2/YDR514C-like C-terminal domain-containing protein n=1 Tax=Elsinoe australis TaxID=40998 RepID=A0A2P8AIH9_9PEZI|nr:hypothetical protein B9Z65_1142 [Elsinoe australis]